jgi:hypothetical protein
LLCQGFFDDSLAWQSFLAGISVVAGFSGWQKSGYDCIDVGVRVMQEIISDHAVVTQSAQLPVLMAILRPV